MRTPFLVLLWMALVIAGTYWYQTTASVCPVPLSYRLGDVDESFNISQDEAKSYIKEAEAVWEDRVNRELFVYDDEADLVIDFVYDDRQALANSEESRRLALDKQNEQNDIVLATIESAQQEYESLSLVYKEKVSQYEADLSKYNDEVNRYNDRGGAPPDVYVELDKKRQSLNAEASTLSDTADKLNKLVEKINSLTERGSQLVNEYNREVNKYNAEFGFEREFTQGDYQSIGEIHVYKFSSQTELVRVLAHEFGHALGFGHVEDGSSVMYYLLEDTNSDPVLSEEDVVMYDAVCGKSESFGQKARRTIRELLNKLL